MTIQAKIDKNGVLTLLPTEEIEVFALSKWAELAFPNLNMPYILINNNNIENMKIKRAIDE